MLIQHSNYFDAVHGSDATQHEIKFRVELRRSGLKKSSILKAANAIGVVAWFIGGGGLIAAEKLKTMTVDSFGESGTIAFKLQVDQNYRNGRGQENYRQSLIRLPGIFDISFSRTDPSVNVAWIWDGRKCFEGKFHDIIVDMTDLPGPEIYFLQYTWDSGRGISEAYLNGTALRVPGATFSPWWIGKEVASIEIGDGRLKVSDVTADSRYTPPEKMKAAVPDEFRGRHSRLTGFSEPPCPLDVDALREIIPSLIKAGVDILEPLQKVAGMEIEGLKRDFGNQLCFHGGIDTQFVLPHSTPAQVEADVPVENIDAIYKTTRN